MATTARRSSKPKTTKNRSAKPTTRAAKIQTVEVPAGRPVAGSFRLVGRAVVTLVRHWKLFAGLAVIYAVLELVLAQQLVSFDINSIKQSLGLTAGQSGLGSATAVYNSLFAAAGGGSAPASAWHFSVLIVMSLIIIWGLRQVWQSSAEQSVSFRQTLYGGTGQLVPFVLLLVLILLQLVPMLLGVSLYGFVVRNAIAVTILEQLIFLVILLLLTALSIFWLTRSVPALYVVTLDGMTPRRAFADAKQLVRGRRLSIARKIIFLPVALFVAAAIITVPAILLWPPLAQWLFFVESVIGLFIVHGFLYGLYRELLGD